MRKISSTTLWLLIFTALIAVQAYSAFGQTDSIVGNWKNGRVGTISYQNRVTGSTKPGRGSLFTYRFLANGTYEYIGYMEITMYNCTTTLFNQITGKYSVDGTTISLNPSRDFWKNTNSCAASGNKQQTKTPTKKSLEFETKTDESGADTLCLNDAGTESCFRREK